MIGYLRLPLSVGTDRRPFVPQKETLISAAARSASCQSRKWADTVRTKEKPPEGGSQFQIR
jgi:hypothetical protein